MFGSSADFPDETPIPDISCSIDGVAPHSPYPGKVGLITSGFTIGGFTMRPVLKLMTAPLCMTNRSDRPGTKPADVADPPSMASGAVSGTVSPLCLSCNAVHSGDPYTG